jgi:membrane fusion protein, multidrug efflux system
MKLSLGIVGLVFTGTVILGTVGFNREILAASPQQLPAPAVTVTKAISQDVPVYLNEIGKSGAFQSVTVTPQIPGRIMERNFEDGTDLKKGELLCTIDPRPYQAALDSATAQLAEAKATLDLANTQLKMYASIAGTRAVSQMDYETKKNTVAVDEAQVQAAEAAVENAKLNLDYCYIRSPIDGRAGARLVDAGNVVQGNTTAMLLIQQLDPIYADFTITERDLYQVQQELARGLLKTLVRTPADPVEKARSGNVTFVDNNVQNATGTVNLRATIANHDHHFWPGQFVNVTLILSTAKGAVLIPNQATQVSQQGPFVYIVKSDSTVDLRQVTLGQRQGDNVVISSGVSPGENVVVTGQLTLRPGAKVRIVPSTASGALGPGGNAGEGGKS